MSKAITWVGMDAHKEVIYIAMLVPGRREPVEWRVANEPTAVRRMVRKIERAAPGSIRCCYEAGPCGYVLQRQLAAASKRLQCEVIAPSLIPAKPGERIKTDRRDARKLAELLRAGLLTEVVPPTEEQEAVRDVCRCRAQAKKDLLRSRHRLSKFLLRRGVRYDGSSWTSRHHQWLRQIRFDRTADATVFLDYLLAVQQLEERITTLEAAIEQAAQTDPYRDAVGRLGCFRGIATVTAMTVLSELHDVRRFDSPRQLTAFLGLVPSEHSSVVARRGGITKAGNSHVRRVLVEAAHHYRHRPIVGRNLRKRREGQPNSAIAIADKAHSRLHRRFRRLTERGKPHNKAVVAVARELVGFIWATLHESSSPQRYTH